MDKKTLIAFVLIGLILVITQTNWYKKSVLGIKKSDMALAAKDSVSDFQHLENTLDEKDTLKKEQKDETKSFNALIDIRENLVPETIQVSTNKYQAILSTKGATIQSWILSDYIYKDNINVELIKDDGYGNLGINIPIEGDTVKTYDYIFRANKQKIVLNDENIQDDIIFEFDFKENRKIRKTYTFYNAKYSFDVKIELINMADIIVDQKYVFTWLSGLRNTEMNIGEDVDNSRAYVFLGGDKVEFNLAEKLNVRQSSPNIEGKIDWIAIRTKYFASIIFPKSEEDISVKLAGYTTPLNNKKVDKNYSAILQMKIPYNEMQYYSQDFQIYIGPLDYYIIKEYHSGFDKIMGYGPAIIRPFAKLTIKVFRFLHEFIPNYGLVLIVFSILVKIIVYPLTKKSYVAMSKMQNLQPLMNEIKEKYKNDPTKMNKEMMALYKEHGANPLSGCIPTLLQMPLLWAIFLVFRNTIQLRQAPFILWINDLSSPDTILIPFTLPLIGNSIHIIPILMGITMFIQQKMTMKDPKQKAMVYFMPIFLTFIFYNFPSGLNLYYTLFNIFSMIQQKITPDRSHDESEVKNLSVNKKSKK